MTTPTPTSPRGLRGLTPASRRLFRELVDEYGITDAGGRADSALRVEVARPGDRGRKPRGGGGRDPRGSIWPTAGSSVVAGHPRFPGPMDGGAATAKPGCG